MVFLINISPEPHTGGGSGSGGGPEDDPGFARTSLRSQGLMTLAFGFALGLAMMLLFWLIPIIGSPTGTVADFFEEIHPNLWLSFLSGFIAGVVIALIYNFLTVRRLNFFGLESAAD